MAPKNKTHNQKKIEYVFLAKAIGVQGKEFEYDGFDDYASGGSDSKYFMLRKAHPREHGEALRAAGVIIYALCTLSCFAVYMNKATPALMMP